MQPVAERRAVRRRDGKRKRSVRSVALPKFLDSQLKVDKREQRLREKFPRWSLVELYLRHCWGPDKVLAWYRERFPGEPAPSRMTLFRFLADKPESWFVTPLDALELVTAKVPRLLVLERQAAMIQVQESRISRALHQEKTIQAAGEGPYLHPEIRENIALLARMYHDHFQTLQESGLEPKSAQKVKVEQSGAVAHHAFPFLKAEEAARLRKIQEEVDAGRIDVMELYRTASGIFKAEQEAADGRMLPRE
jgi:hypothetical protein